METKYNWVRLQRTLHKKNTSKGVYKHEKGLFYGSIDSFLAVKLPKKMDSVQTESFVKRLFPKWTLLYKSQIPYNSI